MMDATENPFDRFAAWLDEAGTQEPNDPNAVCLATVGVDGMPSARMVLLKGLDGAERDPRGFVFYTNLESRKGTQIEGAPKAALCFHWKSLRRSVRVEGACIPVADDEADAYFDSRPRGSRIGAWASAQSRPLDGRWELEKKVAEFTAKFGVGAIPRPPHWSGIRVVPRRIEFWKDGQFRLHDRLVYHAAETAPAGAEAGAHGWATERLYP